MASTHVAKHTQSYAFTFVRTDESGEGYTELTTRFRKGVPVTCYSTPIYGEKIDHGWTLEWRVRNGDRYEFTIRHAPPNASMRIECEEQRK